MYKDVVIGPTKRGNAGICPKYDDGSQYDPHPPEIPDPEKQMWPWCGEAAGSLCTFPFTFGSELLYEPYMDSQGVSRCGTKSTSAFPIEYASVGDLDLAIPCNGE